MTEQEKKYLFDILIAVQLIEQFIISTPSFEVYKADLKTKSAVERQLGIIGEAIAKFIKEPAHHNLEHAKQIVGLRNRLIHAYDNIDDTIIWAILNKHIMPLEKEVQAILNNYSA